MLVTAGAVVVVLALVIGLLAYRLGGVATAAETPTATPTPTPTGPPTVAQVFTQTGPSVVIVQTASGKLGAGVIAADDGTILTADHVISGGGGQITVTFSDGTTAQASVASADPSQDIATLTPDKLPELLVPATIGGDAAIGTPVIAIGNPLGLTYSVSSGVVSGVDRRADTDQGTFSGLIQFDASVNPGSSGGPLLDQTGDVIGIVVSIADPGRDDAWAGVGFAVPIGAALGGGGSGDTRGPQI